MINSVLVLLAHILAPVLAVGPTEQAPGFPRVSDGTLNPQDFRWTWVDGFDTLDPNKWEVRQGPWKNGVFVPENVNVSGSILRLYGSAENLTWTQGGVISRQTMGFGFYQARLACPQKQGWHSAFWMTSLLRTFPPPYNNIELDVLESDSPSQWNTFHLHFWTDGVNPNRQSVSTNVYQVGVPLNMTDWVVLGTLLDDLQIRFYVNGRTVFAANRTSAWPQTANPMNMLLTIVANSQVDASALPATFWVDWVGYYRYANLTQGAPTCGACFRCTDALPLPF
jgi:hypothetical protein